MSSNSAIHGKITAVLSGDNFFEQIGIASLPEPQRSQTIEQVVNTIIDTVFLKIQEILTPEELQYLSEYFNRGDHETGMLLLLQKIPNLDLIIHEEVLKYKYNMKAQIESALKNS